MYSIIFGIPNIICIRIWSFLWNRIILVFIFGHQNTIRSPLVWKDFRLSGNFPDCLKTFQTVWKLSRLSKNFPDCLETFKTARKISRLFENYLEFPDCQKTFKTVLKPSILAGKFPDSLETFQNEQKLSIQSGTFHSYADV